MAGNDDQVAALLFWGGEMIKNGYLGSVDYSEPPKTVCFLSRSSRHDELVAKVHAAMNTNENNTSLALFGKYPTTLPGGKVVFVSIPLTDNQSWKWFWEAALLTQPVHVYVMARKRTQESADRCRVKKPKTTGATMNIFLKELTGRVTIFEVESSATVSDLMEMIRDGKGIPTDQQRLIFSSSQLDENRTLASYNIQDKSTISFVLRLCGC